jgi:hypothetical protein
MRGDRFVLLVWVVLMSPLTLTDLFNRSLELWLEGLKLLLQGVMCFARIIGIHAKFGGDLIAGWTLRASQWVEDWQPVRMP